MKRALADLGSREISPLALAAIALVIVVTLLWVPIRLTMEEGDGRPRPSLTKT